MKLISHRRLLLIIGTLYAIWWLLLAINPHDRSSWALENVLVVVFMVLLAVSYKYFPLSRISYTLIFLFMCLHSVGAHYTYAQVPYDVWFQTYAGFSLNELVGFERNHFDRLVHFCYGLLLAYPIREFFIRIVDVKGFWAYFLPLDLTMSTSMMFELFEWGAAEIFGGDLGIAYLGTQGDVWDAHKDMALASLGALIAMSLTAFLNSKIQRDFAREWNESLSVKIKEPLGEEAILKMVKPGDNDQ